MRVWHRALVLGLSVGLLGVLASVLPPVVALEENVGLDWLFRLRGPRPAPPEVVVVSIDLESSERLGLPRNPEKCSGTT